MTNLAVIASSTDLPLSAAPIERAWVHTGTPQARNAVLSRSADGMATTLVWDCTAGSFEWHYDIDETIYILEGEATISDRRGPARTYRAGDVVFLPRGAVCDWQVETYVRKVAFCRRTQPRVVSLAIRASGRLRRIMSRRAQPVGGFAGAV